MAESEKACFAEASQAKPALAGESAIQTADKPATRHTDGEQAQTAGRHPGGRPRLEFDLRQVEELGRIQSTQAELAAVLGCGLTTVKDRLDSDPEFAAAYESGLEAGKSSLRRLQWKAAVGGNITMQIWLGKQYLGQRDMQSTELTGAKGERLIPAETVISLDDDARALLRQLRARLPRPG